MSRRLTFSRLAFTINQQTNNGVKTMSRSYPIWVNTFNDNYGNAWAKSMGVKNNSTANKPTCLKAFDTLKARSFAFFASF